MKKLLLTAAVVAASLPVLADDVKKSNQEETLVTATRVEQPVYKSLASVSVVTREDIVNSSALSLPELLGGLPGIDFITSGGRGSSSAIYTRGTSSDHTLILIDGVRSASATSGTTDLQRIPLDQIERIEVVRGPRSSLYGAEAIGGVIQIFTRQPEGGTVTAEIGSDDMRKASFSYGGGDQTKYKVTAGHEKTNGFDNTERDGTIDDDNDGYEELSLSMSVNHKFDNNWAVGVAGTIIDTTSEFDSGGDDYTDSINQSIIASVDAPINELLQATFEIAQYKDESETFGSNSSIFDTKRSAAESQLDYTFSTNQVLSAGLEYYNDEVESTSGFTEESRYNRAYFLQYQGEIDLISVSGSFRSDDNESFGRNNTRSFSLGYNIAKDTLVSVSYGSAFKAPTFNDLYYPPLAFSYSFGGDNYTYAYSGNPDVKPEESESYEIMIRSTWKDIKWTASYYETDIENLIELVETYSFTPPNNFITDATVGNISNVNITGAEFTADFEVSGWDIHNAISYTDPKDEDTDELIDDRARGKINVSASKAIGDFKIGLHWLAQSHRFTTQSFTKYRLAGYNKVDVSAKYELGRSTTLTAKVNNIFDNDYVVNKSFTGSNYQTPGVNFTLAVSHFFSDK